MIRYPCRRFGEQKYEKLILLNLVRGIKMFFLFLIPTVISRYQLYMALILTYVPKHISKRILKLYDGIGLYQSIKLFQGKHCK